MGEREGGTEGGTEGVGQHERAPCYGGRVRSRYLARENLGSIEGDFEIGIIYVFRLGS